MILEKIMADKPDDRLKSNTQQNDDDIEPKIYIIVNDKKLPRPGLETFFAQAKIDSENSQQKSVCDPVGGTYCSCNKVCSCVPVCGCVGNNVCSCVPVCSCVGHTAPSRGGSYGGCRCAPVH